MTSDWNKNQAGLLYPQSNVSFVSQNGAGGDTPCPPKIWELLSEVAAVVIVNFCWCLHLTDVFIEINAAAAPLTCLCPHRVREAAMTSLMEVTLLLVQNEAELINANM